MKRFVNKAVVVTGAAQGIGKACALRFASEGASLMLADMAEEPLDDLVYKINREGGAAISYIGDLSRHEDCANLMAAAVSKMGRVDVSVHNVGGTIWAKPFQEYKPEQIEAEIRRSLWPTLWCCHAVLPFMLKQRFGSIVNIGSVATRGINRVPYSAAKGGVQAITSSLALELGDSGVRINCVAPGGTEVKDRVVPRPFGEIDAKDAEGFRAVLAQTNRDTPMGRFGSVEEQAATVAFLASEEASYITGQTLYVAGGAIG